LDVCHGRIAVGYAAYPPDHGSAPREGLEHMRANSRTKVLRQNYSLPITAWALDVARA
jgi:hypothetical protein